MNGRIESKNDAEVTKKTSFPILKKTPSRKEEMLDFDQDLQKEPRKNTGRKQSEKRKG